MIMIPERVNEIGALLKAVVEGLPAEQPDDRLAKAVAQQAVELIVGLCANVAVLAMNSETAARQAHADRYGR